MLKTLPKYFYQTTNAAPLAVFRICFGLLMAISILRFWYKGWIEELYLNPKFHFHYYGFEFITVPGNFTYLLFALCFLSALCFAVGYKYRLSITLFFLSFTYIELMDKSTYLNHYYFVSVVSFILIFLPAHYYFSVDAYYRPKLRFSQIPKWTIDVLKLMLAVVYIYAGLAKLNHDWLLKAMPLTLWLPAKFNVIFLQDLMQQKWLHFAFSWAGAAYDLAIPFLLMFTPTRIYAFLMVVIFHLLTAALFPIGMFPYVMMVATLIFFGPNFHNKILEKLSQFLSIPKKIFDNNNSFIFLNKNFGKMAFVTLSIVMLVQLLLPLRFLLYPGNVLWTEQGYRFAWRVMLTEKTGYANFKIVDTKTDKRFYVQNADFLTSFQEKQMNTQADFIIEYAHYLGKHFENQGHKNVAVYVESYAALNGRPSQTFVKDNINLLSLKNDLKHKPYIVVLNE